MKIERLIEAIHSNFYVGVPDSQLKVLCNYLMNNKGIGMNHIIAANEGNAVGIAAGHYMATKEIPVVYMQNSGIGNVVNPVASLLNPKVYGIPCIFIIGWRGEPGIHDEPQHVFQGEISEKLLSDLDIHYLVIDQAVTSKELSDKMVEFRGELKEGKSVAFLIKKGGLEGSDSYKNENEYSLIREDVVRDVAIAADNDMIVSTTGKISRELFEIRESMKQGHEKDFLTVGSMGHSSSIALGIAMSKPDRRVWCLDGDGALLMHMGSMALLGSNKLDNMVHIVIDNEAHETVGGLPTVAGKIDFTKIAEACGYQKIYSIKEEQTLRSVLEKVRLERKLTFIDIKCSISSRADLGRPTTSAIENKKAFMKYLER